MKYTLDNGKVVNIPDREIDNFMSSLQISQEEAIELWLVDNDFAEDEELEELDAKAKTVKINHGASADKPRKKSEKPRTVKVSDAKVELFNAFIPFLHDFCEKNNASYATLKPNKLFSVNYGGETFKIDLIQVRKPKN